MKTRYDSKAAKDGFKAIYSIWLYNVQKKRGFSLKSQKDREGPYKVIKRIHVVFRIHTLPKGKKRVVHVKRLTNLKQITTAMTRWEEWQSWKRGKKKWVSIESWLIKVKLEGQDFESPPNSSRTASPCRNSIPWSFCSQKSAYVQLFSLRLQKGVWSYVWTCRPAASFWKNLEATQWWEFPLLPGNQAVVPLKPIIRSFGWHLVGSEEQTRLKVRNISCKGSVTSERFK